MKYRYQVVFPDGRKENIDLDESHKNDALDNKFFEVTGHRISDEAAFLKQEGYKCLYIGPIDEPQST